MHSNTNTAMTTMATISKLIADEKETKEFKKAAYCYEKKEYLKVIALLEPFYNGEYKTANLALQMVLAGAYMDEDTLSLDYKKEIALPLLKSLYAKLLSRAEPNYFDASGVLLALIKCYQLDPKDRENSLKLH